MSVGGLCAVYISALYVDVGEEAHCYVVQCR